MNPNFDPSYLLPPLIASVACFALVALVLRRSDRSFGSWLLCGLLTSVGLWAVVLFGMRSSPDLHHALLWERALAAPYYITFVFYYHFTLVYTYNKGHRRVLLASYAFLVVVVALSPTNLIIKEMRLEDYGYAPVPHPMVIPLSMPGLALMAGGVYNLLKRYTTSFSHEERNRLLYLVIAIMFPVIGSLLDAFSNLPPLGIWSQLIFCLVCSITILKYHLMDIRIVIRKSLVYLLISVAVAIPYVGLLYSLYHVFEPMVEPWWIHAAVILLVAIALRPLYSWAQQFVDKLFYRDRYDYLKALEQFSHQAQSVTNLGDLGSTMVQLVGGAVRTPSAYLLLPSGAEGGFVAIASNSSESLPSGLVLRSTSPLIKWLDLHGDILPSKQLDVVPQLQSFSLKEKNELERMGAELYVPIKTRAGHLSGILVLGQKLSQQSYTGEDRRLLTAVSSQMGIALENAWLYEETKRSKEELQQRETKYRELAESITDVFFAMNEELRCTYWNKASEELTGISAGDALGKQLYELFRDTEATREAEEVYLKVLRTKRPQHFVSEYQLRGKDFVFEISVYPSRDGLSIFIKDITGRKQAEQRERKLQQELSFSSRLASIGQLAAGVAHELNNPLTGILGFSEIILRESTDEEVNIKLQRIHDEAKRSARIVENLLTFARRREPKKEYSDINDVVKKSLELRAYELRTSNIEVVTDLTTTLPKTMADFHQIQEVFLNIILNAEQAITEVHGRGKLTIKTEKIKGYIRVSFADDGSGIAAEELDKIFDPFFTLRVERGGTGLGLSVCHGIVAEHGGRIYVKAKMGKGSTFFVELPIIGENADKNLTGRE